MRVPLHVAGRCTSRYWPEVVSAEVGFTPTLPRVQLPSTATRQAGGLVRGTSQEEIMPIANYIQPLTEVLP